MSYRRRVKKNGLKKSAVKKAPEIYAKDDFEEEEKIDIPNEDIIENFTFKNRINGFDKNTTVDECVFYIKSFLVPHVYDNFKGINSGNANRMILCEKEALSFYFDNILSSTITALFEEDDDKYETSIARVCNNLCTIIDSAIDNAATKKNSFFNRIQRKVSNIENSSKIIIGGSTYSIVVSGGKISEYSLDEMDHASINIDIVNSDEDIVSYEIVSIWKMPNENNYDEDNLVNYENTYSYYNSGDIYEEDEEDENQIKNIYNFPRGRKGFIEIPMTYNNKSSDNFLILDLGCIVYDLVTKINKIYDYSEEINSVYYPEEDIDYTITIAFNRTAEDDEKDYVITRLEMYLNTYVEIIKNLNSGNISYPEISTCELLGYEIRDEELLRKILIRMNIVDYYEFQILSEFTLKELCKIIRNLID